MRVLHIIPGVDTGGAETMLARLLESRSERSEDIAVLSLRSPGVVGERLRRAGLRLFTLRMTGSLSAPLAGLRMARIVHAFAPDIIHGWLQLGSLAATAARATMARPVSLVWNLRHSLRSEAMTRPRNRGLLRVGAMLSRWPDAVVFNSRTAARQHAQAGFDIERSLLIPNGFDTRLYRPRASARAELEARFGIPANAQVIGQIAHDLPMKDHATLVDAVARARSMGRDLHLLLVGQGLDQPRRELQEKIARLIPPDRVTLAGLRDDVPEWLSGLDMLAMPSAWGESFPQVLGEAMACEVPIVATDVGDSKDIVGSAGLIVPPKDAIGLGQAIHHLASLDPLERRTMGEAGRARVIQHYSLETIADRYADLHGLLYDDSRFLGRPVRHTEAMAGGPAE